jgi:glutaconate CoA-transferase subunit B
MKHEKRRFVENVDFVTSPGFLQGGSSRSDSGLVAGGMYKVVTDMAILGFDEHSRRMKVDSLHSNVSAEQVQEHTGFDLLIDSDIETTESPTEHELTVLRGLDPDRIYIA